MYVSVLGGLISELGIDAIVTLLENDVPVDMSADAVHKYSDLSSGNFEGSPVIFNWVVQLPFASLSVKRKHNIPVVTRKKKTSNGLTLLATSSVCKQGGRRRHQHFPSTTVYWIPSLGQTLQVSHQHHSASISQYTIMSMT
jgi:hypothetical protein